MKKYIVIFVLVMSIGCKKIEDAPTPIKSHVVQILYKTYGDIPHTHYFFNYNNEQIENTTIDPSGSYSVVRSVDEGSRIVGSISANPQSGYWKEIKVVYNNDTIFNQKKHEDVSFEIILPKL